MKLKLFFIGFVFTFLAAAQLPKGFVYITDVIPSIKIELRYFTTNNFLGSKVDSYQREVSILSEPAANELKKVQDELLTYNLSLKIFDSYRPQSAVNHFVRWARDLTDTINKAQYYPDVKKQHLFQEGYIASKSGHSRGSTVDLTIVNLETGEELDMGSPYDFFGEASWVEYKDITKQQRANRMLLQHVMLKHGFRNYPKEWWHFTLKNEPYPDTYFDFPVD